MCGIVLFSGANAAIRLASSLECIRHRGPDTQTQWFYDNLALGFARLEINGNESEGRQPFFHDELVGVVNGEVYNHKGLSAKFDLPPSKCDAAVLLPLFEQLGPSIIDHLDGFYSAVILMPKRKTAICLRDYIGKKPLFVGRARGEIFVVSELKVLDAIDWFELLPRGVSSVDLTTGEVKTLAVHSPSNSHTPLPDLLENAVRKRMPPSSQPVGVFLSGGLDSSLVAALSNRIRDDVVYFVLGDSNELDNSAAKRVVEVLDLKNIQIVALPPSAKIPELIDQVVFATESYNPSIVSNGLATFLLAEAAHNMGIKVVLTGEGADELFGGYHRFLDKKSWKKVRMKLIDDMQFTELRRLDMSSMAHSVEARCPFLDKAISEFSDSLDFAEMYNRKMNKVGLRNSFSGVLPPEILYRTKVSFDVGSGIRREVVSCLKKYGDSERQALKSIWGAHFSCFPDDPFFDSYPVFDKAIDARLGDHR